MKKNVAIVHYNTPELTEALIMSIRKHGGEDYKVFIFDNSDRKPFKKRMKGVKIFNNRKGQIIDLDKELEKYDKNEFIGCSRSCVYGSDKHMMCVQKLWELIPDGFMLMDSDILIKDNFDWMFMEDQCCCGYIGPCSGPDRIPRLVPMLLWINVPMCVDGGARFFDPERAWALHPNVDDKRNWWDTGAAFLDDIKRLKPKCYGRAITRDMMLSLIVHFGGGSWRQDEKTTQQWLNHYKNLWQ